MTASFLKLSLLAVTLGTGSLLRASDLPHSPAPGSAERRAICEAARAYVIKDYVSPTKLPQPMVFKVRRMEALGNYCGFEALPFFKDGSQVGTEYIMDIVLNLCLKKVNGKWRVVSDLSSTDVPNPAQLKQIWHEFPKDFPFALLSEFWREQFNKLKETGR